jgi:hypothetical protein
MYVETIVDKKSSLGNTVGDVLSRAVLSHTLGIA